MAKNRRRRLTNIAMLTNRRHTPKRKATASDDTHIDWEGGRAEARQLHARLNDVVADFDRIDQECKGSTSEVQAERHRRRVQSLDNATFAVERHMNAVRDSLLKRNMLFVDTQYDGSCGTSLPRSLAVAHPSAQEFTP